MTFETRLSLLIFNGVQEFPGGPSHTLFTDPVTGSTFSIPAGQPIGQGLADFIIRWKELGGGGRRPSKRLLRGGKKVAA